MNPIKNKMNQVNISFTELQEESGLSKSTVARVLKGDKIPDNTRVSTLSVIAKTLDCQISDFFPGILPSFESAQSFGLKISNVQGAENMEKVSYNCLVKYDYANKFGPYHAEIYFICNFFRDKQTKYFKDVSFNVKADSSGVVKKMATEGMYTKMLNLITQVLKACDYPFLESEKKAENKGTLQFTLDTRLGVTGLFVFQTWDLQADRFTPLTY